MKTIKLYEDKFKVTHKYKYLMFLPNDNKSLNTIFNNKTSSTTRLGVLFKHHLRYSLKCL